VEIDEKESGALAILLEPIETEEKSEDNEDVPQLEVKIIKTKKGNRVFFI
jgi:hypothetical protein